jgi:hypothetical protein
MAITVFRSQALDLRGPEPDWFLLMLAEAA